VVTEPFTEWVLGAGFRTPHPDWSAAGATLVDDVGPFEQRKLWLLNGAHSLMAYAGALRGHATVQQAIADPVVADWVEQWWDQACRHLPLEPDDLARYRAALRLRFANPALRDALGRIGADGSQKIPIRWVPAIRADLAAGRTAEAGLRGVAGWVWHLRGATGSVTDARQAEVVDLGRGPLAEAVAAVLAFLGLPAELTGEVVRLARQLRITAPV
jgi:fructuronate reductase